MVELDSTLSHSLLAAAYQNQNVLVSGQASFHEAQKQTKVSAPEMSFQTDTQLLQGKHTSSILSMLPRENTHSTHSLIFSHFYDLLFLRVGYTLNRSLTQNLLSCLLPVTSLEQ